MTSTNAKSPSIDGERSILLDAILEGSAASIKTWLDKTSLDDTIYVLCQLDDDQRASLLSTIPADEAAELLTALPESHAITALEGINADVAADILEELPSNERVDFVKALHDEEAQDILAEVEHSIAADIKRLADFDEGTTGALMQSEFFAYDESLSIRELLDDLQTQAEAYTHYNIQYIYVTSAGGTLRGVLPIRRLLLAGHDAVLGDIMIKDPIALQADVSIEDARAHFDDLGFLGLPVVDGEHRLIGVIERSAVDHAEIEEAEDLYRQAQGIVGGEELRSMPLVTRSRRRLAWLSVNIVLNIIAASVIALHQDTLEAVIALAVFLPIISDMSGCSGNQAVAVSMRELTLGVTRPADLLRVLVKESSLGVVNGLVLGLLIGLVAFLWQGNAYLGAVVGGALMANTVIAVCIGGSVPLILKRLKVDPALAAGPILTTVTDMCGFMLVLSMASLALAHLA